MGRGAKMLPHLNTPGKFKILTSPERVVSCEFIPLWEQLKMVADVFDSADARRSPLSTIDQKNSSNSNNGIKLRIAVISKIIIQWITTLLNVKLNMKIPESWMQLIEVWRSETWTELSKELGGPFKIGYCLLLIVLLTRNAEFDKIIHYPLCEIFLQQ